MHSDDRQLIFPIFGPPGPQQGGFSPPGPPFGGGQANMMPTEPPPSFTPKQAPQPFAIDASSIRGCLFRFTYIWLRRDAFWFFPVHIGRRSISGFRWIGFRWTYFGIDLRHIQSFQCV